MYLAYQPKPSDKGGPLQRVSSIYYVLRSSQASSQDSAVICNIHFSSIHSFMSCRVFRLYLLTQRTVSVCCMFT